MRTTFAAEDGFLLAMAHHHLGDRPRAKQLLAEAVQWVATRRPTATSAASAPRPSG